MLKQIGGADQILTPYFRHWIIIKPTLIPHLLSSAGGQKSPDKQSDVNNNNPLNHGNGDVTTMIRQYFLLIIPLDKILRLYHTHLVYLHQMFSMKTSMKTTQRRYNILSSKIG